MLIEKKRTNFIWTLSATTLLARNIKNNQCTIPKESFLDNFDSL